MSKVLSRHCQGPLSMTNYAPILSIKFIHLYGNIMEGSISGTASEKFVDIGHIRKNDNAFGFKTQQNPYSSSHMMPPKFFVLIRNSFV